MNISESNNDIEVERYVPSRVAYAIAAIVLFISGITGGFIGYAMMTVFFPGASGVTLGIGACIICAGIVYGVSVITSLGLQASVEWKARKGSGTETNRPSRLVRTDNRD